MTISCRIFGMVGCYFVLAGCARDKFVSQPPKKEPAAKSDAQISPDSEKKQAAQSSDSALQINDWAFDDLPMSDKCKPAAGLAFRLSEGLSPANRYLLARFGKLGSDSFKFDQTFLSEFLAKAGFRTVKIYENKTKGVQGFYALSEKMNLVVFRGTHSRSGVMTDLNFFMTGSGFGSSGGGVHGGFKSAYESVKTEIQSVLSQENVKKRPTFFVGHSLGGALSTLAAADALAQGVNVAGLLTLGQPRTGNTEFAGKFSSALREKYLRYVHANDPVPHLPLASVAASGAASGLADNNVLKYGMIAVAALKFAHIGMPLHLGRTTFLKGEYSNDEVWDQSFWSANKGFVQSLAASGGAAKQDDDSDYNIIADHEVEKYLCEMVTQIK
jgi:hypothetical protein